MNDDDDADVDRREEGREGYWEETGDIMTGVW